MAGELLCTVISLVPFEISEEKPGLVPGRYVIRASDTFEPQVLHVNKALHYVYLDETRGSLQVRDGPDEVARSIVDDYIVSQLGIEENARPALFWVPGELSVAQVKLQLSDRLSELREIQQNWFVNIARIADNDWARYHQHNVISNFQRKAAQLIGWRPEEHEWMSDKVILKPVKCPSCGNVVEIGTVVCPACRCVLDEEKHKSLTFA